jgi:hypothetical protein
LITFYRNQPTSRAAEEEEDPAQTQKTQLSAQIYLLFLQKNLRDTYIDLGRRENLRRTSNPGGTRTRISGKIYPQINSFFFGYSIPGLKTVIPGLRIPILV